jgi:hypothetical protein
VATLTAATSAAASIPAATTAAAAIPATATRPFFTSASQINSEVTAVQISAIHRTDGFLSFFLCAHRNESETARPPAGAIGHEVRFEDGAVRGEGVLEIVFGGVEGEISDKQFIIHAVVFFSFLESLVASKSVPASGLESSRSIAHVTIYHRLKVMSNPTVSTIDPFGQDRKTLLRAAIRPQSSAYRALSIAENRAAFILRRLRALGFSNRRRMRNCCNVCSRSSFFFSRRMAFSTGSPFFNLISVMQTERLTPQKSKRYTNCGIPRPGASCSFRANSRNSRINSPTSCT